MKNFLWSELYRAVVGKWPDKSSFGTWFGWSQTSTLPNFFSCTLNCAHGNKLTLYVMDRSRHKHQVFLL